MKIKISVSASERDRIGDGMRHTLMAYEEELNDQKDPLKRKSLLARVKILNKKLDELDKVQDSDLKKFSDDFTSQMKANHWQNPDFAAKHTKQKETPAERSAREKTEYKDKQAKVGFTEQQAKAKIALLATKKGAKDPSVIALKKQFNKKFSPRKPYYKEQP